MLTLLWVAWFAEQHITGFFTGVFPMVPDILYGVVDVRDVATMHVQARARAERAQHEERVDELPADECTLRLRERSADAVAAAEVRVRVRVSATG